MVYKSVDHARLKTQVEPQATGEWFSMVYKSVDHAKLWSICFLE